MTRVRDVLLESRDTAPEGAQDGEADTTETDEESGDTAATEE